LDNAKDQPLDFSSFEGGDSPASQPPNPNADSGRTTIQEQGPTVMLPKAASAELPAAGPKASSGDETAMLAASTPRAEDMSFNVDSSSPATDEAPVAESAEEEPAFPPIVADRPAASVAHDKPGTSASCKAAEKKGWWPFGAQKKPAQGKPAPAAGNHQAVKAADSPAAEPAPPLEAPAAQKQDESPPAGDADDALNQFFKSLK
jgi:hypothetical protein